MSSTTPDPGGTPSALALAGLLAVAGLTHLLRPRPYDRLIPPWLGRPRPWVVGSGIAELACAVAVAVPGTRRRGALATAALLVAVFPGNVQMALDSRAASPTDSRAGSPTASRAGAPPGSRSGSPPWTRRPAVAWGRLPLQVPLVLWAWRVARRDG